ncbi:tetratricopeptide (TPR) repeat protein [Methylopila capsulata]|uniref:Tetratricopeptide (TPR) repeat protein n=1 Tax=Methylopila capsulata TaxID=61654 RepID=A0A9W6MS72_9HYPH|nr:SIR2 family protein [Methylopila capsulata]MBM7850682.1 tetratricopeptide (TPR) repeat protein [Methylopila capsulata]GLK55977.1 hypothetical protein GCM10008170_19960 [Methylopila capsulata]
MPVTADFTSLEDAFRNAIDGNAILFVGAGASHLAENKDGQPLPNGADLTKLLRWKIKTTNDRHSLAQLTGHYVRTEGSDELYNFLHRLLSTSRVDKIYRDLLQLNWTRIYTTNYDNAIEVAKNFKNEHNVYDLRRSVKNVPHGAIVHLNGYINHVSPHNIAGELLLTDASYSTSNFSSSAWAHHFRSDISNARSVVFIGYSLYDLDIARILIEDPAIKAKTTFVVAPNADEIEVGSMSQYGTVLSVGVEGIWTSLTDIVTTYQPRSMISAFNFLSNLSEAKNRSHPSAATEVYNQLIFGQVPLYSLIQDVQINESLSYLINRTQVSDFIERSRTHPARDVFIVGEIASGKTFAALQLAKNLIKGRYTVYVARSGRDLRQELGELCRNTDPVCVVFDGYRRYIDEIKFYVSQRPANHRAILTERLVVHEYMERLITDIFPEGDYGEIVLERLDEAEIAEFDNLINFAGLWGDDAGESPKNRRRKIHTNFSSSLYKLLLELVLSQHVRAEIKRLLEPISQDVNATRFFATAFIMNVLGHDFVINDWQSFHGITNVRSLLATYREAIEHFVTTDATQIKLRSGLASAALLSMFASDATVANILADIYRSASNNSIGSDNFKQVAIDVTRYGSVEPLFQGENKFATIVNYYELIRPFGNSQNNPDYWLQYGIACTIHGSLDRAETAFQNAYARERVRDRPNLIRIDNYFARYQMKKALEATNSDLAFDIFKSAGDALNRQIWFDNNRHYPFKTGRAFSEIARKYFDIWSHSQKAEFILMCRTIREKAIDWKRAKRKSNPDVDFLIAEIRRLLDRL